MVKFLKSGILELASIFLVLATAISYSLPTSSAQAQETPNSNQTSPQRLTELVNPHLTALSDALEEGNITKALDQSRLIEAQLFSSSLNQTTIAVGNATKGQGFEDYTFVGAFGQLCYVDEWFGLYGTYYQTTYCY